MGHHTLVFKIIMVFSLIMCIGILASCSRSNNATHGIFSNTESLRIYEMYAGKGSFAAVPGDSTGTVFQLTLNNVPADMLYFTDQPARKAGSETVDNVMNNVWPRVYGVVAPNAILKGTLANNKGYIQIYCMLDKPVYTAVTGQLGFTVTYLEGNRQPVSNLDITDVKMIILNNTASAQSEEWSHLMAGDSGTFEHVSGNTYTFHIQHASADVLSFTNAPARRQIIYTVKDFMHSWQARFGSSPPNVSIAYDQQNNQTGAVQVVTLTNPLFDEATGGVSFMATRLYGTSPIGSKLTVNVPSLFIDNDQFQPLKVTIKNTSDRTAYVKFFSTKPVDIDKNDSTISPGSSADFNVNYISAGRIYVSYDSPLDFSDTTEPDGARNTPDNKNYLIRFDKVELTYTKNSDGKGGGSTNLTAVDFYSMPMVLETSIQGTTIEHLTLAGDKTGNLLEAALLGVVPAKYPSPQISDSKGKFVRILAPVKFPQAYPGYDDLLGTLSGSTLKITGKFYGSTPPTDYDFSGSISADNITLNGVVSNGNHVITIPMTSLKSDPKGVDLKNYYGIFTCNGLFYVDGKPHPVSGIIDGYDYNDVYSAVYRDLVTAFNLGYIKPGANDSSTWWSVDAKPFQGSYNNAYAKTIAGYYPGAYGFSFSDRYKSVLADLGGRIDQLTITLLSDDANPPPYTQNGSRNPETGDYKFNLSLTAQKGSGFDTTKFYLYDKKYEYSGGKSYNFPNKEVNYGPVTDGAAVNSIPARKGLNIYDLIAFNKKYSVFVYIDAVNFENSWGSAAGGANGNAGFINGTMINYVGGLQP